MALIRSGTSRGCGISAFGRLSRIATARIERTGCAVQPADRP
jgi:hypothetical protein